jgi:hypothetical protein
VAALLVRHPGQAQSASRRAHPVAGGQRDAERFLQQRRGCPQVVP